MKRTRHGLTDSPEYEVWSTMIQRCTNPHNKKFRIYGGRGIHVCDRWRSFANFYADMGPRPAPGLTLDRIDNDGDYCPGNCRWATPQQQAQNSRRVLNAMARLARLHGLDPTTVYNRRFRGWTLADALTVPLNHHRPAHETIVSPILAVSETGSQSGQIRDRIGVDA